MKLNFKGIFTSGGLALVLLSLAPVACGGGSGDDAAGDGDGDGDGDVGPGDGDASTETGGSAGDGDGDGDTSTETGGTAGDGDAPLGTGGAIDFEVGETADDALVVINEFMPSNGTVIVDEMGGAGDFIELYNLSAEAVDLGGYFISDKLDEPLKHALPAGLVIEPGATLLLWADSDVEEGASHLPFNLAKDGEAVVLSDPSGEVIDSIDYVDATTDSSFARVPDGTGAFAFCTAPTPGAENDASCAP